MNIIDLKPSFYCLYIRNRDGEEELFSQVDAASGSTRRRLDLFETEATAHHWIMEENKIHLLNKSHIFYGIYNRLYPKKIFITEFLDLMKERQEIDSISFINKNGVRRLYFRNDLLDNKNPFPISRQKLHPKEPIYIINRQKRISDKTTLAKDFYVISYPVIGIPLFSVGITEWADDLINRVPNKGYYIEKTSLFDIYMRVKLKSKYQGFFIFSREMAPHYILRKRDLKKIIDGSVDYV